MTTDLDKAASVIRASCKRISDAMIAKGLSCPQVNYSMDLDGIRYVFAHYDIGGIPKNISTPMGEQDAETLILAKIAAIPDAATRDRAEFLRLAAAAADFAAKTPDICADPELEAIRAGITATMRKLSENAIAGPSHAAT